MQNHPSNLGPTNVPKAGEDTRPLGAIIAELWENTERLARQEISLGLAQIDQRVDRLKGDLTRVTMGGAVIYAGVLALVASMVMLLAKVIDPWLSALIVGFVVSGSGYALLKRGTQRLGDDVEGVGDDARAAGREVKEIGQDIKHGVRTFHRNESMREAVK
jgi:hypothetical protein